MHGSSRIVPLFRLLLAALLVSAAPSAPARPLQQVLNEGTLRVGIALFSPWAFRGGDDELHGFEVDVARQLAGDMGLQPELLVYDWEDLIPALESGEIDIIAAGLTITPERALHVNFSQPYASGGVALATNLASTAAVESLDDLDSEAYRLAVVDGTVAVELARRVLPDAELVEFDDADAAGDALVAGEVDAYLEDEPVPSFLALEHPERVDVPLARPLLRTRAGFAVNKGDPDFLAFLNAWIVAREADTWLPTTYGYWFETLSWRHRLEPETPE